MHDPASPAPGPPPRGEQPPAPRHRLGLEPAAIFLGLLLSLIWAWWAWQDGAYFGVVLLPGGILLCVGAALAAQFAPWPFDLRRSPAVAVAIAGLVGLGLWAGLSALWSPAPDIAVGDGQRILFYALAFVLGLWLCGLLGRRAQLSMVPMVAGAAVAGIATIVALITSDVPRDVLELDGTLDFPLGYRNATVAFFAIALFPAIGTAADPDLDWRLRGAALGTATLCINLALLAQSRASLPALVAALVVLVLAFPLRLRVLGWLALAALPALGFISPGLDLYQASADGIGGVGDEMQGAGVAAAITAVVGAAIGAVCARLGARVPIAGSASTRANRPVAVVLVVLAVAGAAGFVVAVGDPIDWLGERLDELRAGETPDLSEESTRFTVDVGSRRYEYWRIAADDFADDPLLGTGGGGFQYSYLRERDSEGRTPRDAHSIELETMAEYGGPGLLLLLAGIGGAGIGALRTRLRALEPGAVRLAAVGLAAGTYWLIHTSVDWFFPYPAVTAPVLALLGAACAPAVARARGAPSRGWRLGLTVAVALLALAAVPQLLSERYVNDAYAGWRENLNRAYADLDRAHDLNPLSVAPLLAEGAIAQRAGDRERAVAAFRAAAEERPEEWAAHYLIAKLLARSDPEAARAAIRTALKLNPRGVDVINLARDLGLEPPV